jgi:hypothetical protein
LNEQREKDTGGGGSSLARAGFKKKVMTRAKSDTSRLKVEDKDGA